MGVSFFGTPIAFIQQLFYLGAFVLCLFGCRAIPTFWRPKSCKKPRHTEKIFASALCSRRKVRSIGRALARHSRLPLVFRVLRKNVASERNASLLASYTASAAHLSHRQRTACGNFEKYNCRITFERSSHNGLKTSGLALDFLTVPFRR